MGQVVIKHYPERYVDQGGPCGHSDPFTGADDCTCRDGYVIPAYFTEAWTEDYCDGLGDWSHAEGCQRFRPSPF